jgi:hypothetical protein
MLLSSGARLMGAGVVFIAIEVVRVGLVLGSVLTCIVTCGAVRIGESVVEDEEGPAVLF